MTQPLDYAGPRINGRLSKLAIVSAFFGPLSGPTMYLLARYFANERLGDSNAWIFLLMLGVSPGIFSTLLGLIAVFRIGTGATPLRGGSLALVGLIFGSISSIIATPIMLLALLH